MAYRSRQRAHHGGKFKSERQRRFMWAHYPRAAHKWAHNYSTKKTDWVFGAPKPAIAVAHAKKRRAKKGARRLAKKL